MLRKWPLALGAVVGLLALYLGLHASADPVESWRLAARWTARAGFPVFLVAYSASSLGRLWHSPLTRAVWRDRRWWGLGFAACHTVHLFALLTFLKISGETRPLAIYLVGGTGYVLMYLMALTSTSEMMRLLGRWWKRLHTLGIHWLWFVFAISYLSRVVAGRDMPYAGIALAAALAALGLRIAAWAKGRSRKPA